MSDTGASADVGEARRRAARLWQFPVIDRSWPDLRPAVVTDEAVLADFGSGKAEQEPPPVYRYGRTQPVKGDVPVQRSVSRTVMFQPTIIDIKVRTKDGTLIRTIQSPAFGNYGADPNDPAMFNPGVDPRTAICSVLAPYAAARCRGGLAYF
jgi:hypothetical protein